MADYTNVGCEQSETRPTGGNITSASGPFYDNTCDGGCALGQRLQIVYKKHEHTGTDWIGPRQPWPPNPPKNTCGEWISDGANTVQLEPEDPKLVFYGTLWDFWGGFQFACADGAYPRGGGGSRVDCCNHRTAKRTPTDLQAIVISRPAYNQWGSTQLVWYKIAVNIVVKFGMGKI